MANVDYLKKIYELLFLTTDRKNKVVRSAQTITKADALSSSFRVTTMDYGEKTTWYQNAVEVKGGTVTINADESDASNNVYVIDVPNAPLIDIYNPRLSAPRRYLRKYEDAMFIGGLLMADGTFKEHKDFEIKLYKDGIDITSHISSIDYTNGKITTKTIDFLDSNVITADYYHLPEKNASQFILRPYHGVKWYMRHVEMQLSVSVSKMPTVVFEVWGGKEDYDYNFDDPMDRAYHIGYEMHYRSGIDYINVGNEGKGTIPAHYNLTSDLLVFPFNYDRALDVGNDDSTVGKLIRIYTPDDSAYEGTEICTTSFYIEQTRVTL